jgi:hypothetical protein
MHWPNKLDHKDMNLFLKECRITGIETILIDTDHEGRPRTVEFPVSVDHISRAILGSIEFWEQGTFVKRYYYNFEKEVWTWGRRPWA